MNVIENKKKLKSIPKDHERKVFMELQQMESSNSFVEYKLLPRRKWAYVHRLNGLCKEYHAVGIAPSHRMTFKVLGKKGFEEIKIREYSFDYHKEKRSC